MSAKQPIASEVLDLMDRLQRDEGQRNVLASSWKLYEAAVADGLIDRGQIDWLARCMQELHSEGLIAYGLRNGGTAPRPVWNGAEIQQMHDWRVTADGRRDASLFRAENGKSTAREAGSDLPSGGRADVFISHASEDKPEVARPLADALTRLGWKVWLDELELKIGDSLSRRIDEALARSRFGVVILSPAFFAKEWPQRELAGLAARELDSGAKVILPVWHEVDHKFIIQHSPVLADRLGVRTSAGIQVVCEEISSVLADDLSKQQRAPSRPGKAEVDRAQDGESMFEIPSTAEQQEELLRDLPDWWEHRFYAGVLLQGRIEREDKWQDHQLRLPRGPRRDVDESSFSQVLKRELGWIRRQVSAMDRVFDPETTEAAFGSRGESGNALLIRRLAEGVLRIYEGLMDWAASLRNMNVDEEYEEIVELMARMVDGPVRQIHDFIQQVADQIARIPLLEEEAEEKGATEEAPTILTLSLTLAMDEGLQDEFQAALARAR